jgi:hypothetical protein
MLASCRCSVVLWFVSFAAVRAQLAHGPLAGAEAENPYTGWVVDHFTGTSPSVRDGVLRITGNARSYLVKDFRTRTWRSHEYVRIDLNKESLRFTIDLSEVPCGCLACVYLVTMGDPTVDQSNYCDAAENVHPGIDGGLCVELDLLEANNHAIQTVCAP